MSVELFKEAQSFFSKYVLKDEKNERVGELWFSDPSRVNVKGKIDVKVLTQQERALLHFSITGEIPKGFNLKQLQDALQGLKGKSVRTEGEIDYEHSTLSSMAKKMQHVAKRAIKGNVIKTDHLYQAIEEKEKAIESLWSQVEKSKKGNLEQPHLNEIREQFFMMVRSMPQSRYDELSKLTPDEIYARVLAQMKQK